MPHLNGIFLTTLLEVQSAFDRRLDADATAPICLALSGGGDSIALLHLAAVWTKRCGRRLLALTVDHRLNPDSAAWTAFAGAAATAAGAEWRALHWTGEKPAAGLPAAARAARHRLLAKEARVGGASVILFAHTADDAMEGDLMRMETPTLGRLKEWSPSPVWPEGRGIFAFRPLLGARRSDLRAWLRAQGRPWLEDPANGDSRFARTRARAMLAAGAVSPRGETKSDEGLARLAMAAEAAAAGALTIPRSMLTEATAAAARRFLSIAVLCASGRSSPPRGEALERLSRRLAGVDPLVATLAGSRIEADALRVAFAREAGDMRRAAAPSMSLPPMSLQKGRTVVWDGRFEIKAARDILIAPLTGSAARLSRLSRARLGEIPAMARPSLPALFDHGRVLLPHPFGDGPAQATALAGGRLAAACGLVAQERDISHPRAGWAWRRRVGHPMLRLWR